MAKKTGQSLSELSTVHNKFDRSLIPYLDNATMSDLTVTGPTGISYRVHRAVLANSSAFFRQMLHSDFKESTEGEVSLMFDDSPAVWELLLKFMYGGLLHFEGETFLELMVAAQRYMVSDLFARMQRLAETANTEDAEVPDFLKTPVDTDAMPSSHTTSAAANSTSTDQDATPETATQPTPSSTSSSPASGVGVGKAKVLPHLQDTYAVAAGSTSGPGSELFDVERWPDHLLEKGFLSLLDEPALSDFEVVHPKQAWACHKLLIAHASPTLSRQIQQEGLTSIQVAHDPDNVFPDILKHIYGADYQFTRSNTIPTLLLCIQFDLTYLLRAGLAFLSAAIPGSPEAYLGDIIKVYREAVDKKWRESNPDLYAARLQLLARYIGQMVTHAGYNTTSSATSTSTTTPTTDGVYDLSWMPTSSMIELLKHPFFTVETEMLAVGLVLRYQQQHAMRLEQARPLFAELRLSFLPGADLVALTQGNHTLLPTPQDSSNSINIPQDILVAATCHRLLLWEGLVQDVATMPTVARPRQCHHPLHLPYTPSTERAGLFEFLGSVRGTRAWQNPAAIGQVVVKCSAVGYGSTSNTLARGGGCYFETRDSPRATWVTFDIGESLRMKVKSYCLRHARNDTKYILRNWELSGSDNGKTWVTLSSHHDDQTLTRGFELGHWELPWHQEVQPYRYFRLSSLKGGNSHSSSNRTLCFSSFDLFGEVNVVLWNAETLPLFTPPELPTSSG